MSEQSNDNWSLKTLSWSILVLFFTSSCEDNSKLSPSDAELARVALEQKITVSQAAGKPVLVVAGEAITTNEIIYTPVENNGVAMSLTEALRPMVQISTLEQFKEQARPQVEGVVNAEISNILLYQLAKRNVEEHIKEAVQKSAERELRKFVLGFGGDEAKADEELEKMGLDRDSFIERQKKLILTQYYLSLQMPDDRPVTYDELVKCYHQMKDEFFSIPARLQFRLIDIQPANLKISDPNQDRLEYARKLANELLRRIKAGEDFGELAKQYSHGHMREFGGLWTPLQPDSLAKPYDILAAEAEKIEQGQIAGPIETAEHDHIFIMKLEEKRPRDYEPFEQVQRQVEQKILSDRKNEVINRLRAKLQEQAALGETNEFVDFCLKEIYQMNKQ